LKKSGKTIRRKILKMPCGATKSLNQQITILKWPREEKKEHTKRNELPVARLWEEPMKP
jgi:hypothetical protein